MKIVVYIFIAWYLYMALRVHNAIEQGLLDGSESSNRVLESYKTGDFWIRLVIDILLVLAAIFWPAVYVAGLVGRKENQ